MAEHLEVMLPLFGRRRSTIGSRGRKWLFEEPRWSLSHPLAVLRVGGTGNRRTLLGYAENISCNGMMIGSVWPKEVGSRLQVEFALPAPADLVVQCTCEVIWARPHSVDPNKPGMGLKFLDLPGPTACSIESLCDGDRSSETPACRTWSDYDQAWIPWTPPASR
jgi:hypothetical protein